MITLLLLGAGLAAWGCGGGDGARRSGDDEDGGPGGRSSGGAPGNGGGRSGGAPGTGGAGPGTGGADPGAGGADPGAGGAGPGAGGADPGDAGAGGSTAPDASPEGGPDADASPPADSGPDAPPDASVAAAVVTPLYATNGPFWNDYVKADGTTRFDASDTPCDKATDGPTYEACIHGGEIRALEVTGRASCAGLTATDALGAFDWTCVVRGGTAWMVSSALKADKHMADLLDFTAGAFRGNSVTVSDGSGVVALTEPAVWWANRVRVITGTTQTVLPHDVLLTTAASTGFVRGLDVDKVAYVTEPGAAYTGLAEFRGSFMWLEPRARGTTAPVTNAGGSFVVVRGANLAGNASPSPGLSITARASVIEDVVASGNANNVILQVVHSRVSRITSSNAGVFGVTVGGATSNPSDDSVFEDISDDGSGRGVVVLRGARMTFRRIRSDNAGVISNNSAGIYIDTTVTASTFEDLTSTGSDAQGMAVWSSDSTYRRLRVVGSAENGIEVRQGRNNRFEDILVADAASGPTGRGISVTTTFSFFQNVRIFGVRRGGLLVGAFSRSTRLANVLVAGGETMLENGASTGRGGNVIQNATFANAHRDPVFQQVTGAALYVSDRGPKMLLNVLGLNAHFGLLNNSVFGQYYPYYENLVLVGNSDVAISLANNASLHLAGEVRLGRDTVGSICFSQPATLGLSETCQNEAPSTANITPTATDIDVVVGPVTSDAANASDTGGTAPYAATLDFTSFETPERVWGKTGASTWPGVDQRGRCTTGDTCQIYDFSLRATDTTARNIVAAIPTGNDVLVSFEEGPDSTDPTDQAYCDASSPGSVYVAGTPGTCQATFLKNAVEVMFDGIGDDDNFCESNETCLFSPNAGAYQGHGPLVSAGTFVDGQITGVTLVRYQTNGR